MIVITWDSPDDGGSEEAQEVAAAGELEAGDKFFGDGGAANEVPALEDGDGEAGACEVRGGSESVMAAADNQRVPFLVLQRARSAAAEAPSPHPSVHSSLYGLCTAGGRPGVCTCGVVLPVRLGGPVASAIVDFKVTP